MIKSSIFDQVEQLSKAPMGNSGKTVLDILFGYAKLVSMDKNVLNVLFQEEKEQRDLANVMQILDENKIDVELLKQAAPFFRSAGTSAADVEELANVMRNLNESQEELTASQVLQKMLEVNVPDLEILKKGHTIDDVLSYLEKKPKKAAPNASQPTERKAGQGYVAKEEKNPVAPEKKTVEEPVIDPATRKEEFKMLVKKTEQLYERLKCKVIGQDEAIRLFAEGFFQSEIFLNLEKERKGPSTTFLFAGPPGVGKTYLASVAAEILDFPFLRLDMSEFGQRDSVQRLSGVPKTYAVPKPGMLTQFVKENPRSIILLDEIEKASEEVIFQFLQIMDGGVLTDECLSESISFKDTILIFTTNAGKKLYENRDGRNLSSLSRAVVMKEIENEKADYGRPLFPPAICSRFASGNVIMFNHLGVHHLVKLINGRLQSAVSMIEEGFSYKVSIDERIAPMLIYSQSTNMDARNMSSQSSLLLKNSLYEFARHVPGDGSGLDSLEEIELRVKGDESKEISELFEKNEVSNVLYVGDASDIANVPFGQGCNVFTCEEEDLLGYLAKSDVEFVLIKMSYDDKKNGEGYLSLDDIKTDGVKAFDLISAKLPQMPVYIVHQEEIKREDQTNFLERGARDFIAWKDDAEFADEIAKISKMIYMQRKVDELSGRGRVIKFNMAQRLTNVGKKVEIIFYDFKIAIAADADENKLLLSDDARPKEKFDDVIGAEDAKSELTYFVEYLKNPKKYMAKSIKPPKGILLYGPPGTGKTMLARAMAGESDVSFFAATATGFMNKYVGESEKNIKMLFNTAKKFAPSIIFIDEIDAIGKERTGSESTHHTESMLNALLTEMDGFEVNLSKPVFVVAATNYDLDGSKSGKRSGIDAALLRRFDNRIYVDLPKESERNEFLTKALGKVKESVVTEEAIRNVAQRTTGESLAILKNIVELAIRNSGKAGRELDNDLLLNALEEYMYGEKKEWNEEYYKSVSIHESGHAYVAFLSGEKPSFVTIVSRGNFGGYMQHENQEKTPSYTQEQLLWRIRSALAGRAAEVEFFGDKGINTGISSDLQNATRIALDMICTYGMAGDKYVSLSPDKLLGTPEGKRLIEEADTMIRREMEVTQGLVHEGRDKIQRLAEYLQKNNQATEKEILEALEG